MSDNQDPILLFIEEFSKLIPDTIDDYEFLEKFYSNKTPDKISKSSELKSEYKQLLKEYIELLKDVKKETNSLRKKKLNNEELSKNISTLKTTLFKRKIDILNNLNSLIKKSFEKEVEKEIEETTEKSEEKKILNNEKKPEIESEPIESEESQEIPEIEGEPIESEESQEIPEIEGEPIESEESQEIPEIEGEPIESDESQEIPEIEGEPIETQELAEVPEIEGEPIESDESQEIPEIEGEPIESDESQEIPEIEGEPIEAQELAEVPEIEGEPIESDESQEVPEIEGEPIETQEPLEIPEIESESIELKKDFNEIEIPLPNIPELVSSSENIEKKTSELFEESMEIKGGQEVEEITNEQEVSVPEQEIQPELIPRPFLSETSPREIIESVIRKNPNIAKLLKRSDKKIDYNLIYKDALEKIKNNDLNGGLELLEKCLKDPELAQNDRKKKLINEKINETYRRLAKIKNDEANKEYKRKKYELAIKLWSEAKNYYDKLGLNSKANEIKRIIERIEKRFNLKIDSEPELIISEEYDENSNIRKCPECNSKLEYIEQYHRYFCHNCKKYV
ncbi:MAG: hypothetical protein ACTSPY_15540 [Candidatus Helarchaeota archaeon]